MEIRLMFEELMKRIPDMQLTPGKTAPDAVRLEFSPSS